ncbi:MAG: ASCH domain-containing protein [Patescibacteria group bacterium]|jgi:ASC-1-like (ASCH) protein
MHHVAIMNKSWKLIPKVLSGEKTVESRWYQTRRTPWDKIATGDTIFFKNSSEAVTAEARVLSVKQFEVKNIVDAKDIIEKYGQEICLVDDNPAKWRKLPKYCILIWLVNPKSVEPPFLVNKKRFGSATAWITVDNIKKLKINIKVQ